MEFSSDQETRTDCLNSRFPGKARVSGVGEDKEGFLCTCLGPFCTDLEEMTG